VGAHLGVKPIYYDT